MLLNGTADKKDLDAMSFISRKINDLNKGITQKDFFSDNIIDFSDVSLDDMRLVENGVLEFGKDNGCYAALPPFETGSFIDRTERRFTSWKVLDVDDDYFRIEFSHYPVFYAEFNENVLLNKENHSYTEHGDCWFLASKIVLKVKLLTEDERVDIILQNPVVKEQLKTFEKNSYEALSYSAAMASQVDKQNGLIGGIVESYEFFTPKAFEKIRKSKFQTEDGRVLDNKVVKDTIDYTLDISMDYALQTMIFSSIGPIIEAFTYFNYMLSDSKQGVKTIRKISPAYVFSEEITDIRKERHFGKIRVVSEKKPRQITKENVQRIYKTLSWQRRSHIRHLKSGKVIPIKAQVCNRHIEGDKPDARKVIYKV